MSTRAPRQTDAARFVERFGSALTEAGMQRLPSRVFAALLADEDGRMTAAEIGEALSVSAASVSGAVRHLQQMRMIHREREPGTRRDVYVVADDAWHESWAVFNAHPLRPYQGAVTYYLAERALPLVGNTLAAWRRAAPRLAVTRVPGAHDDLLSEEYAPTLAARISATAT